MQLFNKKNIKIIIFDLDGTLLDSISTYIKVINNIL